MAKFATLLASLILVGSTYAFAEGDATGMDKNSPVEKRITELHTRLKITTEQEDLWKTVAQEMRDSSTTFNEATRTREDKAKTMTAVDDLNSYANLTSMHAESMKKFVTVFTPLYDSMSDTQKKNADEIFRGHKAGKKKAMAK